MRNAAAALVAVIVAGLAALLAAGLARDSALVYTLGVVPQGAVVKLSPGQRACQSAIVPPDEVSFERIGFYPRGTRQPPPAVEAEITPAKGGPALGRGLLAPGYSGAAPPELRRIHVGRIRAHEPIAVCFRNRGAGTLELWGTAGIASPSTSATINGKPIDVDMGVTLEHQRARSLLRLLPEIAERASVFHPQWASPAAYGLLAAIVLVGVPALLAIGLRRAAASPD